MTTKSLADIPAPYSLPRTTLDHLVHDTPQAPVLIKLVRLMNRPDVMTTKDSKVASLATLTTLGLAKYSGLTEHELLKLELCKTHVDDFKYLNSARKELGLCSLKALWAARAHTGNATEDYTIAEARVINVGHAEQRGYVQPPKVIRIERA